MNLFELFIKIGVDDEASKKVANIAEKLGGGLKTAAAVGTAAVAAASTAAATFAAGAVKQFAEYEQLVGGVDTLFKNASRTVQEYANQAYKNAGMSANEYMANATAFSASLISSLGGDTQMAAEYANRAMVSMSDNANKMGTSLDTIVRTYQSLSRGNMAMLDNLKLGYGGTKAELQRLIADAASYTEVQKEMGVTVDASSMSFANIVNAIAVVQGHLGIADATAQEASTTVEGSLISMKAAWTNLVTGIATENANVNSLLDEFLLSVGIFAENVIPVFQTVLANIVQLLINNGPAMAEQGINQLVNFITGLTIKLPDIVAFMGKMVVSMGSALLASAPQLLGAAAGLMGQLLGQIVQLALNIGESLVKGVWNGIQAMAGWFWDSVMGFFSNIVSGVKSLLGIHSPSRVFAEIGKNMALGLGGGWDDSIDGIKSGIMGDMDFGTANYKSNAEYGSNGEFGGIGAKAISIVQNIYSQALTAADLMEEALYKQEEAVLTGV